jgi:hypothetical protein
MAADQMASLHGHLNSLEDVLAADSGEQAGQELKGGASSELVLITLMAMDTVQRQGLRRALDGRIAEDRFALGSIPEGPALQTVNRRWRNRLRLQALMQRAATAVRADTGEPARKLV